jgi:hypothetical protein
VQIDRKKKIMLFGIFSLVSFTIAVTIVRGSIFGGLYKTIDEETRRDMDVTWIWFWFFIEFAVCEFPKYLLGVRRLILCSIHHRLSRLIPSFLHSESEEGE